MYKLNVRESPKPIQYDFTRVTQTYTLRMYKCHLNLYNMNVQKSSNVQARSWAYARTPVRIIIFKSRITENSKSALQIEG